MEIDVKELYEYIVELRNRLSNDGSGMIFEEDHIMLDYVLNLLEKELNNEI